jgi:hypothetical protein
VPGKEPVVERRPHVAHMQQTRRRRSKANAASGDGRHILDDRR